MDEIWRTIKGHTGYEVSNLGRVRSWRNRQGHPQDFPRILSPGLVGGYRQIKLGRARQIKVHTLVLETFVGPRPEGMLCRHLDGNPQNNALTNLRWGTPEENYADRHHHGTDNTGSRHGRATIDEQIARQIKDRLAMRCRIAVVAEEFGVSRGVVARISAGKSWTHV